MKIRRSWFLLPIIAIVIGVSWWFFRPLPPVQVGLVAWMSSGSVVGSSEIHAGNLFIEESQTSALQVLPIDDGWDPKKTANVIDDAMKQGIRFFISAHPSKCALASAYLFADGRALMIDTASTTPELTGKDDGFLRIAPDAVKEQQALAQEVSHWKGKRILVLQDESNLPYTDPAFAAFSAELKGWQIDRHKLMISAYKPAELRSLMASNYDALYILAGTFQPAIGYVAQLFNREHPDAPILLTPWARSPAILETTGDAIDRIVLSSIYPSSHEDRSIGDYYHRFNVRFGYQPHSMTIGIRQALELLNQAFAAGHRTPESVKQYLLSVPTHQTSLGTVSFNSTGDVDGHFYFIRNLRQEL